MHLPPTAKVVAEGVWIYGGTAEMPVAVISLEYDFWYEMAKADEQLEPDEEPTPLGPEGVLYYSCFTSVNSGGYPTIIQAKGDAQTRVQVPIAWGE